MIVYKLRCRFHRIYCFDLSTGSVENAKTICQTCPFQIECLLILTENDDHSATEKQKKTDHFCWKTDKFCPQKHVLPPAIRGRCGLALCQLNVTISTMCLQSAQKMYWKLLHVLKNLHFLQKQLQRGCGNQPKKTQI